MTVKPEKTPYIVADDLDSLIRHCADQISYYGSDIVPSKGECRELTGVILELTNARARVSQTETRGIIFSSFGELAWQLSSSDSLEFIEYYITKYSESSDDQTTLKGAYGPRIFGKNNLDQFAIVEDILRTRPASRQAVIQIYDKSDLAEESLDVPCTCTLHFLIRDEHLILIAHMRSNDIFLGLPHDIFCFTMLQEILATSLGLKLGYYKHMVGSLHLYDVNKEKMSTFLQEGHQIIEPMPPMPTGNNWEQIKELLHYEEAVRTSKNPPRPPDTLPGYWKDIGNMFLALRLSKLKSKEALTEVSKQLANTIYEPYVRDKLGRLQK